MAQDLELLLGDGLDEAAGKEQVLAARNPMAVRLATSALQSLHRFGAIQLGEPKASLYAQSGDPFSHAAQAALVGDVRIVVFGHTHEALVAEFREGIYVNSGAWANVVRLPASADRKSIVAWLKGIENNSFEVTAAPTYVLVEPGGSGVTVSLNQWTQNGKRSLWSKHISR
jgi:predicted phosphodiesterase